MEAANLEESKGTYLTPYRVQAWFLGKSRQRWKQKYKELKVDNKRLKNRVADVTKSREKWRQETEELSRQVQELQAKNAALQEQAAAKKKYGPHSAPGLG
jgi:septal ring factor EnvC (AmiA/AmiB activator)